jgi:nucleotide-binding universal stress UspA family protein
MHIRTILMALDGSATSERALGMAEDLAATYGARLILTTVLEPVILMAGEFSTVQDPTPEACHIALRALEDKAVGLAARGCRVETCVEVGDACGTLLRLAERFEADVIVAGRSGKGAVARALLGSVTTALLHRSAKPILVVP